ncbi:hypothetical protein HN014_04410 [Aquimarina sp. TRL1]|uniref:hypothetical protein n=1 Tax=Aquimarina sp. (strain TRL1) TaxID=2736252 RepID=UPI0015886EBC|nr:hypothetical protein [Aquimarina sp. TRL1]QKX04181.1 hypothetical protein HN014_04410 [Aquimarina sp. TRL1]
MKVHFSINWSKTKLYNAGKRDLTIYWKQGEGIPRIGEAINIPKFIEGNYEPNEVFKDSNTELNVFDCVETNSGWEVKKVIWDHNKGTPFVHVLVGDKG